MKSSALKRIRLSRYRRSNMNFQRRPRLLESLRQQALGTQRIVTLSGLLLTGYRANVQPVQATSNISVQTTSETDTSSQFSAAGRRATSMSHRPRDSRFDVFSESFVIEKCQGEGFLGPGIAPKCRTVRLCSAHGYRFSNGTSSRMVCFSIGRWRSHWRHRCRSTFSATPHPLVRSRNHQHPRKDTCGHPKLHRSKNLSQAPGLALKKAQPQMVPIHSLSTVLQAPAVLR